MKTLIPFFRLPAISLILTTTLSAALPRTLDEADAFARTLINDCLYDEVSIVTRGSLQKMRVTRDETRASIVFVLPRDGRHEPDITVTVTLRPTNSPLSVGHQRSHQLLQRHQFRDYGDDSPYAEQAESYDRIAPSFGPEAACIQVRGKKRRADKFAVYSQLELAWLPHGTEAFGVSIHLGNLYINMPADGSLGSDPLHRLVDEFAVDLMLATALAARQHQFIDEARVKATQTIHRTVSQLPRTAWDSPRWRGAPSPPRHLTLPAMQGPVTTAAATVTPPSPPAMAPPPPSSAPETITLSPEEVLQLAIALNTVDAIPSPTPKVSAQLPAATSPASVAPLIGVRGARRPPVAAPGFTPNHLMQLLFDPDVRLLLTKSRPGFSATVYAHAKGDWAAAVIETDEGFHLPLITPKRDFPGPLADLLKLSVDRPSSRRLDLDLSPLRLAVLRTLFELVESTRTLIGPESASLASFSAAEILTLFSSPRTLSRIDALPPAAQWEIQSVADNAMLLEIELTTLRQHRLVRRLMINGQPAYRLSPTGHQMARLVLAPSEKLRVTRIPARMTDLSPSIHLVNSAHFFADQTAFITYLPTGLVRYEQAPWQGGPSVWKLFTHLTEPEPSVGLAERR